MQRQICNELYSTKKREKKVNIELDFKNFTEQEIFELIRTARDELKRRYERYAVYEPTGRNDIDSGHYKVMREIKAVVEKLSDI